MGRREAACRSGHEPSALREAQRGTALRLLQRRARALEHTSPTPAPGVAASALAARHLGKLSELGVVKDAYDASFFPAGEFDNAAADYLFRNEGFRPSGTIEPRRATSLVCASPDAGFVEMAVVVVGKRQVDARRSPNATSSGWCRFGGERERRRPCIPETTAVEEVRASRRPAFGTLE